MGLLSVAYNIFWYFLVPYSIWISIIIFLAMFNLSFGIRRGFVSTLLNIFEWARQLNTEHLRNKYEDEDEVDTQKVNGIGKSYMIERDITISSTGTKIRIGHMTDEELEQRKKEKKFELRDMLYFCRNGIEAIIEDGLTQRFAAQELSSWNFLTRNSKHEFINTKMSLLWGVGFVLRYFILFPFRLSLFIVAFGVLVSGTAIIGATLPEGKFRKWCYYRLSLTFCRIATRSFSAIITFHNKQYKAKGGGICVANHTSPIDIFCLGCDNTYALVGQTQGGFFGMIQRAFGRAEDHIWFERAKVNDRLHVRNKLQEHVDDKNKLPILIFPEGTCINNTSIMMFKKGSFETGGVMYPAAIRYDPRFGDAFWNSSKYNLLTYLFMLMTSWALVCEVWYLPPETKKEDESAIEFASRVRAEIARQGGLVDLDWDGQLKRYKPKPNVKQNMQHEYSKFLKGE